jgi:hypothetical protein
MVFGDGLLPIGLPMKPVRGTHFCCKAERRGIQRASIELALNLLATNTEQPRPLDKFRMARLPPKCQLPLDETPMWLPLEPHERPVEMNTYKYTNILRRYRQWKVDDYREACGHMGDLWPNELSSHDNHLGPSTLKSSEELESILQDWLYRLLSLQGALIAAEDAAPRPVISRLLLRLNQATANFPLKDRYDTAPLTMGDLNILRDLARPSWYNEVRRYSDPIPDIDNALFGEFECDLDIFIGKIPFWSPGVDNDQIDDPDDPRQFEQPAYDREVASIRFTCLFPAWHNNDSEDCSNNEGLLQRRNNMRLQESMGRARLWNADEAKSFLEVMQEAHRIQ